MTRLPSPTLLAVLFSAQLALQGCKHTPTEKEQQGAQIHYDLGIQSQQQGDLQGAYKEFQESIRLDPSFAETQNALGLLLHVGFNKPEEAIKAYQKALELKPGFSEAKTNLGNVYLAQGKHDLAIALYEQALNDMLYPTPYIAQGNLGWAYFKKGELPKAVDHIKSALTANPKYCLGYLWLGIIHDSAGELEAACTQLGRYRENCPEQADAYYREGLCLAKAGNARVAAERFATCEQKAQGELRDDCRQLGEQLRSAQ